jgi:hypothetical protein
VSGKCPVQVSEIRSGSCSKPGLRHTPWHKKQDRVTVTRLSDEPSTFIHHPPYLVNLFVEQVSVRHWLQCQVTWQPCRLGPTDLPSGTRNTHPSTPKAFSPTISLRQSQDILFCWQKIVLRQSQDILFCWQAEQEPSPILTGETGWRYPGSFPSPHTAPGICP